MGISNRMYLVLGVCAMLVAGGGLLVGKQRERAYIEALQSHHDFTLLDDADELFQLNKFPKDEKLLLIFTPDGIPTSTVKAFYDFSRHLPQLAASHIQVKLITRMNKEIVANFKRVTRFEGRVLLDMGGAVGRAAGVWPTIDPVTHWSYVLVDNQFKIYWTKLSEAPLAFEEIPR
ncbi:MAG: redoxin domain-containing protein [Bacteriovoracia bacterium]